MARCVVVTPSACAPTAGSRAVKQQPIYSAAVSPRPDASERTRELIARGETILANPTWDAFRFWLIESDEFLESLWGRMDR